MSEVKKDDNMEIIDASGENIEKQRVEAMQQKIEIRQKAMIELVMRQTDYTEEVAKMKLVEWSGNYLNVIKEYMNPQFQQKKVVEPESTTKNQMIYGEIRTFMDGVNREQINRKHQKEQLEQKKAAYLSYMKKMQQEQKED
jgi:hypothetical protein